MMGLDGRVPFRRSIFWRLAALLIGVLVAVGVLAVALSALYAYQSSLRLAENSLRLRLDDLAEEIELRADSIDGAHVHLSAALRNDIATRFPDPIQLVDADGRLVETIEPDPRSFPDLSSGPNIQRSPPAGIDEMLNVGDVFVELKGGTDEEGWGLAPLYDASGFLVGGILLQPVTLSRQRELADVRSAFTKAMAAMGLLAALLAIPIGAFLTWRVVSPVRRITHQVARVGEGDYSIRVDERRRDEFGVLAETVNAMAGRVESSIDALTEADRMRRELVANVGHDLRTPLAAMRGYLEEAQRYLAAGQRDAALEALATSDRQGRHLTQLVQDLFELAVLDSGNAPIRSEPIPIAELVSDAVAAHRVSMDQAEIDLSVNLTPQMPVIVGDGVRLMRVLDNLLSNARAHTPPGGKVCVEATFDANHVQVVVRDTGAGLQPGEEERIFERYYRGAGPRTRAGKGTGLGLPISRAVARAHGGTLTASGGPGLGSRFILTMPRRSSPAAED